MIQSKVLVSVYQQPKQGNTFCGDSYFYNETEDHFICAIADGLGSGEYAMESSQAVIDIIKENNHVSVEELVRRSNEILYGKRGVVLGILKIDFRSEAYSFSSIGNIGIMTVTDDRVKKRNIPNSGYLAGYKRSIKVENYKLNKGTNFIMFSDGVKDKELSHCYFTDKNVNGITKAYELTSATTRDDDTTLIAMRYA
ncbi:SpoIIE family protein phosphatase [Oceanobacillus alkalisoli]|uniref:SpoIIE family protein phosphatase n=1 Tax=Oceanobacillus alkalisoli TaxID=2925113 RepID=UPI001EF02AD0|nr:SpoIIE family protein phosphatase [Oceanobacillus alkalisoli]MCF3944657.1 SpoIIE family protein phosphatase [Oceanobacillus alkalisoli]MCG5104843.1 SpoIIE family protein phosphatase [Oceanobacillus alkalisoli]